MSRHSVTYKPGGAVGKPLEMTLKMQRVKLDNNCPACIPRPTGLYWQNGSGDFDLTSLTDNLANFYGYLSLPPGTFYAARLDGDLCGRENSVVLTPSWDTANGPMIWTAGNMIIVTAGFSVESGLPPPCDPGTLTVTATLPGVIANAYPITLDILPPVPA